MVVRTPLSLAALYETDETAWLEAMAQLAAEQRLEEMDHANLSEYLTDMARRDRREVYSRLVLLLTHLLKWQFQAEYRTGSWQVTIRTQRRDLGMLLESGTLRNHAEGALAKAYDEARKDAALETGLSIETFPDQCPWTVTDLLEQEPEADQE